MSRLGHLADNSTRVIRIYLNTHWGSTTITTTTTTTTTTGVTGRLTRVTGVTGQKEEKKEKQKEKKFLRKDGQADQSKAVQVVLADLKSEIRMHITNIIREPFKNYLADFVR